VKDGNGHVTYLNSREREEVLIKNGFPQTHIAASDSPNNPASKSSPHYDNIPLPERPDALFAVTADTGVFLRRVIVHSKGTNVYTVWVRIAHADKGTFGRMLEQYPGSDPENIASMGTVDSPQMNSSSTGELRFLWTSVPANELLICYRFYSASPVTPAYAGKWSYVHDSTAVHVLLKPENCILLEK
jgi:hypothetical protein